MTMWECGTEVHAYNLLWCTTNTAQQSKVHSTLWNRNSEFSMEKIVGPTLRSVHPWFQVFDRCASMKYEHLFLYVFMHTYNRSDHYFMCMNNWMESSTLIEFIWNIRRPTTTTTKTYRNKKHMHTDTHQWNYTNNNYLWMKCTNNISFSQERTQNKNCYRFIDFAMKSFNIIVVFLFPAEKHTHAHTVMNILLL